MEFFNTHTLIDKVQRLAVRCAKLGHSYSQSLREQSFGLGPSPLTSSTTAIKLTWNNVSQK